MSELAPPPFLAQLNNALEAFGFRRVEHGNSDLLLKRQTLNMNRAAVVVSVPEAPQNFAAFEEAVRRDVAKRCRYVPFFWGIGVQLIVVAPGILAVDPSQHVAKVDNQWAITQSVFLVDPQRGEYRSARTWGQIFTGKYQDAIESVLRQHYGAAR